NLIGTSVTPELFDDGWRWDGGFYYKVCATDVHENVSDYTLLEPATITGVPDTTPSAFNALGQNTPNPFNPTTSIRYSLEAATDARLAIYDTRGRLVRTLLNGPKTKGGHTAIWDGKDNSGQRVASGVYFYRLEAASFTQTRKMVFIK
ncbi:MAG: T9SS type A sorting domain-containing protein, partial [Candidatus Krumholzibacteria bacterium]|nr:T9SS type A sorting domain-containing protein [Candidatus Krumholzibacteria bacterium]